MSELKVGDEIWTIDRRNHRAGWECYTITGETRVSWVAQKKGQDWYSRKIAKATLLENLGQWGTQRWYSAEDKAAREFIDAHRYRVVARLQQEYRDADMPLTVVASQLKKIAEILGMELTCNPTS